MSPATADTSRSPFSIDHLSERHADTPLPYASDISQAAQALASGNAAETGRALIASEASNELQGWLGQFGTARLQIDVDRHGGWGHSSGDLLLPLYDNQQSLLFIQGGLRKPDDRLTGNLGYGVRTFWPNGWMYGGNVFFDNDFTENNRRVGFGAESWTDYLRFAANTYIGTTSWHSSRDFDGTWQEKPASGYDVRAQGWLPAYPQLGAKLVWEQYYGDNVALFDKDHLQHNPHAMTIGLEYTPLPLIALGIDHRQGRGEYDDQFTLGMHWNFGHDWHWQIDPANVQALRTLAGNRYDLVDRNNEIVLQYRKNPQQEVARLVLSVMADNSPADGATRNVLQVQATTRDGQPVKNTPITWSVPATEGIALNASAVTDVNGMAIAYLTSTQVQAVAVTAQSGSVSAVQQSHFVAAAVDHIDLRVTQNNAVADGNSANIIVATLTDHNGRAIAGQQVTWQAPDNIAMVGKDAVSDAKGRITLSLTSTVAGSAILSAAAGSQTASATVVFTGNAASAKLTNLTVTTNGSPADGKTNNVAQVIVADANGNPLAGQVVTWKADKSSVSFGQSVATDAGGKATVAYTDTVAESLTLTALLNNGSSITAPSLFVSDVNSARLKDFVVTTGARASGSDTNSATVTVTDANGNLLQGASVSFSVTGSARLSATEVNTDSAGKAQVSFTDTRAESVQVTAKLATGSSITRDSNFVADLDNAVLTVESTTGARADGRAVNTATITLKDSGGNPLPGQTINLTATGSARLSANTGTTDGNGQVVVTLTDPLAQTVSITASLTNGRQATAQTVFLTFSVSGLMPAPASLESNGMASSTLTATVTDSTGKAVADTPVTFTVNGSARLSAPTGTTNSSGTAQVTLTDTTAETVTVVAKAQDNASDVGKTVSVTFTPPAFTTVTANGHTFAVSEGFPTTGFSQAKFTLLLSEMASNYRWVSSQPTAVSVNNAGVVTLIGKPSGSVSITATPTGGGTPATYTFTIQHWFENAGDAGFSWHDASNWCSGRSEQVPTVAELSTGARKTGALWDEWGDLTSYSGAGFISGLYWAADSKVVVGYTTYETVTLTDGISSTYQNGGVQNKAVCVK